MDYSVTFARHFSRLVWLLLREPNNTEEQKAALRALVTVSTDGEVSLKLDGLELIANGSARLGSLPAARELALRLVGHEVGEMHAAASATPADLLNAARVLAEEPTFGADGVSAAERLVTMGAQTVWFLAGVTRPAQVERPSEARPNAPATSSPSRRASGSRGRTGTASSRVASSGQAGSPEGRLRRLDEARGSDAVLRALEDVIAFAETAEREGKPHVAAAAFAGIVRREAAITDEAHREPYLAAIRRLSLPQLLRDVAGLILREPEWRADGTAILIRAGVEGANAVIEQLTKAQTSDDRRVLFDILLKLRAGMSSLTLMLGDVRWYVVRNAAELLGEMKAVEAQGALISLLRHGDERVRRAVVNALLQLDTPTAVQAVQRAVRDTRRPEVRHDAAAALGQRRERTSVTTLVRALDSEDEQHVQFSILAALGKVATPDAVERLITAAEPDRGLFKKKQTDFRIAAVRALGEARTPGAIAALRRRLEDKEPEVREAAEIALHRASAAERSGPSLPPGDRRTVRQRGPTR